MRNIKIAPGEYYHIINRGVNKQIIFSNKYEYWRFIFLVLLFQSPISFKNLNRLVKDFVQHSVLHNDIDKEKITKYKYVELVSFCLMPNHFHLIVKEVEEGGIAKYMQRILNSYTKYINKKHDKSGHLFQGPYKAVHIKDDKQLKYLSTYIHKNPMEIVGWKNRLEQYPWSSYQDFVNENRWGNLLETDIVSGEFKNKKEYLDFVKSSTAKELLKELDDESFLY